MKNELALRNRQRTRAIDLRLLRQIARTLLKEVFKVDRSALGIHLVAAREMAKLNQQFLQHASSTDVLTFDYSPPVAALVRARHFSSLGKRRDNEQANSSRALTSAATLHGEIFISVDDAVAQAKQFRTTWQAEVVRYLIHGLLHLQGHDDLEPTARRAMKRGENRPPKRIARQFPLHQLARVFHRPVKSKIANRKSKI